MKAKSNLVQDRIDARELNPQGQSMPSESLFSENKAVVELLLGQGSTVIEALLEPTGFPTIDSTGGSQTDALGFNILPSDALVPGLPIDIFRKASYSQEVQPRSCRI